MRIQSLKSFIAIIGIAAFGLTSCSTDNGLSVTKRKYRGGYHVEWHGNKKMKQHTQKNRSVEMVEMSTLPVAPLEASLNTKPADLNSSPAEMTMNNVKTATSPITMETSNTTSSMSKAEYRQMKREIRNTVKHELKNASSVESSSLPDWLIAVFCIFLPPLAVALRLGIGTDFWINLILTLIFWIPGIIHAFVVIF